MSGGKDAQIQLDLEALPVETCVEIILAAVRSEVQQAERAEG